MSLDKLFHFSSFPKLLTDTVEELDMKILLVLKSQIIKIWVYISHNNIFYLLTHLLTYLFI